MVGREGGHQLHDDLPTNRSEIPPGGKRHLIWGEGSAARISNELRPQDAGGGVRLTTSWAKMCARPMDTYGRGSGCEEHVSFPLPQGLVERPVPPAAGRRDSPIGSLLKRSRYPQCWSMRPRNRWTVLCQPVLPVPTVAPTVCHLWFGRWF